MADQKQENQVEDTNVENVENTTVETPGKKEKVTFDENQQKYVNQMDKTHKEEVRKLHTQLLELRVASLELDEATKNLVMTLAKVSYKDADEWLNNPENLPKKKEYQNLPATNTPSKGGDTSNQTKPISLSKRRI